MSTVHDGGKVAAICRAVARWAMLAGRIPLTAEAYRPQVLRVLGGDVGSGALDKAIVEAIALWDGGHAEAQEPIAWSVIIRGQGSDLFVDVVAPEGLESKVREVVGAALGAARAA